LRSQTSSICAIYFLCLVNNIGEFNPLERTKCNSSRGVLLFIVLANFIIFINCVNFSFVYLQVNISLSIKIIFCCYCDEILSEIHFRFMLFHVHWTNRLFPYFPNDVRMRVTQRCYLGKSVVYVFGILRRCILDPYI